MLDIESRNLARGGQAPASGSSGGFNNSICCGRQAGPQHPRRETVKMESDGGAMCA